MTTQTMYPALVYVDASAAIAWLERAFDCTSEAVYPGDGDAIAHAQLRIERDLLMLGSARAGSVFGRHTSPLGLGGIGSLALYVAVADPARVFARAQAASAEIVRPLAGTSYDDSTTFSARDCEGYEWSFGSYAAAPDTNLSPCLRYENAERAIAWLYDTCGFEKHLVVPSDSRGIAHAELRFGSTILMCGSRATDDLRFDTPAHAGGTSGSIYVYTPDPDGLFVRVRDAGADIVLPIEDKDYGSREFSVRDPEGNFFSFGTYRP